MAEAAIDGIAGDICRVCRAGATAEQPLYYPCKCSGSIKYVHEECLIQWLQHSRKKYCELCKHPFIFSPIYKESMPASLPMSILAWGFIRRVVGWLVTFARFNLVAYVWLVFVPLLTAHVFYFYMDWDAPSNSFFHGLGSIPNMASSLFSASLHDAAAVAASEDPVELERAAFFWEYHSFDIGDVVCQCLMGSVITILVVALLLSIVLLKEYMSSLNAQNEARRAANEPQRASTEAAAPSQSGPGEQLRPQLEPNAARTHARRRPVIVAPMRWASHQGSPRTATIHAASTLSFAAPVSLTVPSETVSPTDSCWTTTTASSESMPVSASAAISTTLGPLPSLDTSLFGDVDGAGYAMLDSSKSQASDPSTSQSTSMHYSEEELGHPAALGLGGFQGRRVISMFPASLHTAVHQRRREVSRAAGDASSAPATATLGDEDGALPMPQIMSSASSQSTPAGRVYFGSRLSEHAADNPRLLRRLQGIAEARRQRLAHSATDSRSPGGPLQQRRFSSLSYPPGHPGDLPQPPDSHAPANQPFLAVPEATVAAAATTTTASLSDAPPALRFQRPRRQRGFNRDLVAEAENISIPAFLGLQGPLTNLIQNSFIVLACNLFVLHTFFFVPMLCGKALLSIEWQSRLSQAYQLGTALSESIAGFFYNSFAFQFTVAYYRQSLLSKHVLRFVESKQAVVLMSLLRKLGSKAHDGMARAQLLFAHDVVAHLRRIADHLAESSFLRMFGSICVGYAVGFCLLYIFLQILANLAKGSLLERERPSFRRHRQVVDDKIKWAYFHAAMESAFHFMASFFRTVVLLGFELITFPWICGWIMDIGSLVMFPDPYAVFLKRLALTDTHFLFSAIVHWSLGAFFMFSFSVFVTSCREYLRPGVLHFIRNPHDPDYAPMQEIVAGPLGEHCRRLLYSLLIYAFIVYTFVAMNVTLATTFLIPNLHTYRYTEHESLDSKIGGEFALDLLVFKIALHLLSYASPIAKLKKLLKHVLLGFGRFLRIQSYLFGDHSSAPPALAVLASGDLAAGGQPGGVALSDGGRGGRFAFVPNFDRCYTKADLDSHFSQVVTVKDAKLCGIHATFSRAERNGTLTPISLTDEQALSSFEPEQSDADKTLLSHYTVVYRPSYFRTRILFLYLFLWSFVSMVVDSIVFIPLKTGEFVLSYISQFDVKIFMYPYPTGFIALFSAGLVVYCAHRALRFALGLDAERLVAMSLVTARACAKLCCIAPFVLVIWPLCLGMMIELLLWPVMRPTNETPVLFMAMEYVVGFLCLHPLYLLLKHCHPFRATIQEAMNRGVERMRLFKLLHDIILPITLMMLSFIFIPPFLVNLAAPFLGCETEDVSWFQAYSYSALVLVPLFFVACYQLFMAARGLVNSIRDDTYLVGRRLHNLERSAADLPLMPT